jgi:hypothetical protein
MLGKGTFRVTVKDLITVFDEFKGYLPAGFGK